MKRCFVVVSILAQLQIGVVARSADWNQWRGSARDGVADDSPPLLNELPAEGLKPMWLSENLPAARDAGWSSPAIVDGKVYVFTHRRKRQSEDELPKRKFPWLAPDKRDMTDEEYAEYEKNRRDEEEALGKLYRFDEITYCLDAETGETLWTNERSSVYTRFPQSGTPAVIDGKLYALGAGRVARCIDAVTGESIWQTSLPGDFRDEMLQSSFVVADGIAVVLATQLFGLHADSGKVLWEANQDSDRVLHSSPVVWRNVDKARVICNVPGGETICVDLRTGEHLWSVKSQAGNSTPIVLGDRLLTYGSSRKAGLRCFRLTEDGAEHLWTCQRTGDSGSSPVVVGDYVYVQGERRLACVDMASGRSMWMTNLDLNNPRYSSLVAVDGKVVYSFEGVICFAADSSEFRQLINAKIDRDGLMAEESFFREKLKMDELERTAEGQKEAEKLWNNRISKAGSLPCATPAIADGRMYLRLKNQLGCYDLRAQLAGSSD